MKVTMLQYDIVWEDKAANLAAVERLVGASTGQSDLIVLPEMFSTGFSMQSHLLAEPDDGETMRRIKTLAKVADCAFCGSFIAAEDGKYFNRGFFVTPESDYFYDKRHLFRMGDEPGHFSAGSGRLIVPFRGFNICLQVCYDLRFPVWARNRRNEYDLLVYVANWPASRASVWDTLLAARAIENSAYVCGVNRTGTDGMHLNYAGGSQLIDFRGRIVLHAGEAEGIVTSTLLKKELEAFREKFPVWKDGDEFRLDALVD